VDHAGGGQHLRRAEFGQRAAEKLDVGSQQPPDAVSPGALRVEVADRVLGCPRRGRRLVGQRVVQRPRDGVQRGELLLGEGDALNVDLVAEVLGAADFRQGADVEADRDADRLAAQFP
jgi:hypothetical protein